MTMNPGEADILSKAIKFATLAHEGQYRKFSGDPYIVHPLRVMQAVEHRPLTTRIAAILHDVVEDTGWSLRSVRADYGEDVCYLVDALSRRPGEEYGDSLLRVLDAGPEAVAIKVEDLKDNLSSYPPPSGYQTIRYTDALEFLGARWLP